MFLFRDGLSYGPAGVVIQGENHKGPDVDRFESYFNW